MHVYVWEYVNKCKLPNGYCIHHIDEDKGNNSIDNLELRTMSDHSSYHAHGEFRGQEIAREWHSSQEGHAQHVENGYITSEMWPERKFVCKQCGQEFVVKTPKTDLRFCSNACKSAWRRDAGIDNENRTCVVCGKEFSCNKYSKTLCCSRQCAAAFRFYKRNN